MASKVTKSSIEAFLTKTKGEGEPVVSSEVRKVGGYPKAFIVLTVGSKRTDLGKFESSDDLTFKESFSKAKKWVAEFMKK